MRVSDVVLCVNFLGEAEKLSTNPQIRPALIRRVSALTSILYSTILDSSEKIILYFTQVFFI